MDTKRYNKIIDALKDMLSKILPEGSRAVLYGSRARQDATEESDWDIHILVPGDENLHPEIISKYAHPVELLGWEMNEYFSVLVYSYKGWEKRHFLPFYKNVENEKIILYNSIK